jgi:hypothetical protein
MSPVKFSPVVPLSLLLAITLCHPGSASGKGAYCATEKPESALECLAAAYNARDIDAYTALIAPEFVFRFLGATGPGSSWDREQELRNVRQLFQAEEFRTISMTIDEPGKVIAESSGTWRLRSFTVTLTAEQADATLKPLVITYSTQELRIRLEPIPEPHFVIVEWTDQ